MCLSVNLFSLTFVNSIEKRLLAIQTRFIDYGKQMVTLLREISLTPIDFQSSIIKNQ